MHQYRMYSHHKHYLELALCYIRCTLLRYVDLWCNAMLNICNAHKIEFKVESRGAESSLGSQDARCSIEAAHIVEHCPGSMRQHGLDIFKYIILSNCTLIDYIEA